VLHCNFSYVVAKPNKCGSL